MHEGDLRHYKATSETDDDLVMQFQQPSHAPVTVTSLRFAFF